MSDKQTIRLMNQLHALRTAIAETNQDLIELSTALNQAATDLDERLLEGIQDRAYRRIRSLNTLNFSHTQG